MKTVSVYPAAGGWAVKADALESELVFRQGAKAEQTARRIALAMAEAGQTAELIIHLRDGTTAARFICPANRHAPFEVERGVDPAKHAV